METTQTEEKSFVSLYKWHFPVNEDKIWNVQVWRENHFEIAGDFPSYEKAVAFAKEFDLPIIDQSSQL